MILYIKPRDYQGRVNPPIVPLTKVIFRLYETTGDKMAIKFSGVSEKQAPVCFSSVETPGKMHATPMCKKIAFSRFPFLAITIEIHVDEGQFRARFR